MCAGPARWLGTTDTSMGMYGSTMRVRLRRDRPCVAAVLHCGSNKKKCSCWGSNPRPLRYQHNALPN